MSDDMSDGLRKIYITCMVQNPTSRGWAWRTAKRYGRTRDAQGPIGHERDMSDDMTMAYEIYIYIYMTCMVQNPTSRGWARRTAKRYGRTRDAQGP